MFTLLAVISAHYEISIPFAILVAAYNHVATLRDRLKAERGGTRNPDGSISVPFTRLP